MCYKSEAMDRAGETGEIVVGRVSTPTKPTADMVPVCAASAAAASGDERANFEEWMRSEGWENHLERYDIHDPKDERSYKSRHVTDQWEGWKARAAVSASQATPKLDKHLPGWERVIATVTLSGHQLRMALDLINPDGPGDDLQMEDELTFGIVAHRDDNGKETTGMCCWNDDTDGVLPLDGEYVAAPVASQAAPAGGDDVLDIETVNCPECGARWGKIRAAVAAAKVPTVDQVADVVERLIGNVVLDWFGGRIDGDDEPFSSDAHERAYLCEMIRLHGGIGEPAAAPVERGQGAAPSEKAAAANAGGRDAVRDAVAQALDGIYYCGRVWSAWSVGTMREGDFTPAAEVDDVLDEITDAAIAAMPRAAATSAGVQAPAAYFSAESASLLQDIAARPENTSTTIRIHNRSDQWHGHVLPIYTDRTAPVGAGVVPEAFLAAELPSAEVVYRASDMQQAAATAHPVAADDQVLERAAQAIEKLECSRDDHRHILRAAATVRALKSRTTAHGGEQGGA